MKSFEIENTKNTKIVESPFLRKTGMEIIFLEKSENRVTKKRYHATMDESWNAVSKRCFKTLFQNTFLNDDNKLNATI